MSGSRCVELNDKNTAQDPDWKLNEQRACTDCLCWLVFLVFQGAYLVIAGFGFAYGSPDHLIFGYDFLGNTCGSDGGNFDKQFL